MEQPATFIMSLDCEGKWGMADHLQPYHDALNEDSLTRAYERLLALLHDYQIAATFAFVMAFALTRDERDEFEPILKRRTGHSDAWLEPYWRDSEIGRLEGWHCPAAFELVRNSPGQEIACHGFCHRPLGRQTDEIIVDRELDAAGQAAASKGVRPTTFVYPRNDVGHVDLLQRHGYLGYRERLSRPAGLPGKAMSLAAEFNVHPEPQKPPPHRQGPLAIPHGYFFNWRFGARRRVPERTTIRRWSNLLDRTARSGGVAHLWLHPHNLITAPRTGDVLERVLAKVAEARQRGELAVETQEAFCRRLAS